MASPIRLLAVIEAYSITGPAKNLLQFAQVAREVTSGPQVEVHIAVFQRPSAPTFFLDTARDLSIPVYPIPENGRFDSSVFPALSALSNELRPDIVQSHAVKSHFVVRAAKIHRAFPWIAFHHGYTTPNLTARLYNQLDWWSLRAARRVITVSTPFRDEVVKRGVERGRVSIVHNAISPQWGLRYREAKPAAELRAKWGISPAAKVILIVGRLSREKDHITLLQAVARLRTGPVPQSHLVLVGDGPERPVIEQHVTALGLREAITIVGQVPSAEPFYGIADVAVLSSLSEGSPNALLEAMAAGVPVVATRVGGIPEIVSDGESARLIAPRDCGAMSEALRMMLDDTAFAQRIVAKSRDIVATQYSPETRVARLIDIYSTCISSVD